MANDGSITFSVWLDAKEAEKELTTVKKKILDLEAELNQQTNRKTGLEQELKTAAAAAEEAKKRLQELQTEQARMGAANLAKPGSYSLAELRANAAQISAQQEIAAQAEAAHMAAAAAVDKQNAKIDETNQKLEKQKGLYGALQKQAQAAGDSGAKNAGRTSAAMDGLAKKMEKAMNRIAGLAKRVLFFSLFTAAFRAIRTYIGNALKLSDEFTAALSRFKGAAATAFQPLLTAAIPILTTFINVLTSAMTALANFTSKLFGTSAEASAEAAANMNAEAKALDKVGGAAGGAGKKLAKFDEINQLSGGGGGGGGGGTGTVAPDFKSVVEGQMSEIEIYVSGALLALGAILTFSGASVPLGLALMAVGALGLANAITEDWDSMPDHIRKALTTTLLILGGGALVIGAILTFSGANLPLGIGLLASGAAAIGTAASLNWDTLKEKLSKTWKSIKTWFGTNVAPIFTKAWWSEKWDTVMGGLDDAWPKLTGTISSAWGGVRRWWQDNVAVIFTKAWWAGKWDAIKGGLEDKWGAVIGAISSAWGGVKSWWSQNVAVIFTKAWWAGKWDTIKGGLEDKWSAITGAFSNAWSSVKSWWSEHVAVIFTRAWWSGKWDAIKAGLDYRWGAISGKISSVWGTVSRWWQENVAPVFTAEWWGERWNAIKTGLEGKWSAISGAFSTAWDSVRSWWQENCASIFTAAWWTDKFSAIATGMKAAMNAVIGFVEKAINWIASKLNAFSIDIPAVFGASAVHLGFNIPTVTLPRLAQGAVIPPNREFLAVLGDQPRGTNIEAPLDTIVAAFRQVIRETGGGGRTVVLEVNGQRFGQIVLDAYNTESQRIGVQLGGAT